MTIACSSTRANRSVPRVAQQGMPNRAEAESGLDPLRETEPDGGPPEPSQYRLGERPWRDVGGAKIEKCPLNRNQPKSSRTAETSASRKRVTRFDPRCAGMIAQSRPGSGQHAPRSSMADIVAVPTEARSNSGGTHRLQLAGAEAQIKASRRGGKERASHLGSCGSGNIVFHQSLVAPLARWAPGHAPGGGLFEAARSGSKTVASIFEPCKVSQMRARCACVR